MSQQVSFHAYTYGSNPTYFKRKLSIKNHIPFVLFCVFGFNNRNKSNTNRLIIIFKDSF
jgi:hypothetical protein